MRTLAGKAKVELARRQGDVRLKFCTTFARRQMEGGRCFTYERSKSAASWGNPDVDGLAKTEGVMRTELYQCEFGLTSKDELGESPAKRPASLLTKSHEDHRTMGVKCRGGHCHVHLMAGTVRAAAHYPAKFCKALCKGMRRHAKVDASGMLSAIIMES